MKVFGIGHSKTGTKTLGKVLQTLGFEKHISTRFDLSQKYHQGELAPLYDTVAQNQSFEDWPWPYLYREMSQKYEDAKFILTLRKDPETWFDSLCKHVDRLGPREHQKLIYGHYFPHLHKDEHLDYYNIHNDQAINYFSSRSNFLIVCWEEYSDWNELCKFLDKPVPLLDFPHENRAN